MDDFKVGDGTKFLVDVNPSVGLNQPGGRFGRGGIDEGLENAGRLAGMTEGQKGLGRSEFPLPFFGLGEQGEAVGIKGGLMVTVKRMAVGK